MKLYKWQYWENEFVEPSGVVLAESPEEAQQKVMTSFVANRRKRFKDIKDDIHIRVYELKDYGDDVYYIDDIEH